MRRVVLILLTASAVASSQSAIAIELVSGRGIRNAIAETQVDRGIIRFVKGEYAAARGHYDTAIRADQKAWQAYYDRAVLSFTERRWALAVQDLNEAMRLHPTFLRIALLRAESNEALGKYGEAIAELDHLLKLRLTDETAGRAYNTRAWIRVTSRNPAFRNGRLAVDDATLACSLSQWKSPHHIDTLAAAYAETGDFDSAVRYEQQAIDKIGNLGGNAAYFASLRKEFEQRLALFRQHKRPSYQ